MTEFLKENGITYSITPIEDGYNNVIKKLQLTQDTERLRTTMHAIINQSKSM